ncbi:Leucine zipper transcription factor-like protein 1 [Dinochytrium kinnereticum]|nr:Leucine zipper transcription factor-like protein 1 [Dinochytrium kinnereticum]
MLTNLTSRHKNEIIEYLKFVRGQRGQTLRELQCTIEEVLEKRLTDTTYNLDDVRNIADELETAVKSAVECELMHHSHRHILLLQQYFTQGEKEKVLFQGNFLALDDRYLTCKVFSTITKVVTCRQLLQMAAKFEQDNLPSNNGRVAEQPSSFGDQNLREVMPEKLAAMALGSGKEDSRKADLKIQELEHRNKLLEKKIEVLEFKKDDGKRADLRIHELEQRNRTLQDKLEIMEQELNARIDRSTPVQNLKRMLDQKNESLRLYKLRLRKHEPDFGDKDHDDE